MVSTPPSGQWNVNEASFIMNGYIGPAGDVICRGGSQRTHPAATTGGGINALTCYGLFFLKAGSTNVLVKMMGSTAYRSINGGATWASIATLLREDYWDHTFYEEGGTTYLVLANGGASVYKYDGTTWATVSNMPSGVKYVQSHNRRLWYSTGTATLYATKLDDMDISAEPDGLVLTIGTNDGQGITALGSIGGWMVVFKENSISYVEGFGNSDVIIAAGSRGISHTTGTKYFRTIANTSPRELYFLSKRGVERLVEGSEPEWVSRNNQYIPQDYLDNTNVPWADHFQQLVAIQISASLPHASFDPVRGHYLCWFSSSAVFDTACNWAVRVNVPTKAVTFEKLGMVTAECAVSSCVGQSIYAGKLTWFIGNASGFVMEYDRADLTLFDDYMPSVGGSGTDMKMIVRGAIIDWGDPSIQKWVRKVSVRGFSFIGSRTANANVRILREPGDFDAGNGTTQRAVAFANERPSTKEVRPSARAYRFCVEIEHNPGSDSSTATFLHLIGYTVSAEVFARAHQK